MDLCRKAEELRHVWGAFRQSRVLMTANNLEVFEHLQSPRTVPELCGILGTDTRATRILLDALTAMGLVKKLSRISGKTEARYRNTPASAKLLVRGGEFYQGDIIRHADTLWENWSGLDEVLRSGEPAHRDHDHAAFIRGMHNIAVCKVPAVMKALDLKGVAAALDLGGGPGTYSASIARQGIAVTLFDSPPTIAVAREVLKETNAPPIAFLEGDFIADDIGKGYDLAFISQICHAYSADDNRRIIEKSRDALNPGGIVAIQEFFIDRSMTKPLPAALFSVNMLVNTRGGTCYPPSEIRGWLKDAGFRRLRDKRLDDTVLVSGRKPL